MFFLLPIRQWNEIRFYDYNVHESRVGIKNPTNFGANITLEDSFNS